MYPNYWLLQDTYFKYNVVKGKNKKKTPQITQTFIFDSNMNQRELEWLY